MACFGRTAYRERSPVPLTGPTLALGRPQVFYSFAKEIYPSNFVPSPCHRFVRLLEINHKLLRNYSTLSSLIPAPRPTKPAPDANRSPLSPHFPAQNIDGLFEQVGVERMLNCHGSFATASCLRCRTQFPGRAIEADVFASRVALCPLCTKQDEAAAAAAPAKKAPAKAWKEGQDSDSDDDEGGWASEWTGKPLVKPDIVFFGEMLSDEFDHRLVEDREEVDLLIVVGTSLRVAPVASIVSHLPHSVPQIVINRDPIQHANFDIHLLGDADAIVQHLCDRLAQASSATDTATAPPPTATPTPNAWDLARVPVQAKPPAQNGSSTPAVIVPERVGDSHVWLFPGADPEHRWVQAVRRAFGGEESGESGEEEEEEEEEEEGEGGAEAMPSALELAETGGEGEESASESGGEGGGERADGAERVAGRSRSETGSEGEGAEAKRARVGA